MNIIENLANINNNISNIYNSVMNINTVIVNLPDKIDLSNANAQAEDVLENKIYYGPNGRSIGAYENVSPTITNQEQIIQNMYDTYNTLNNTLDTCYLYGINGIPLIPGIHFQGSTNFDGKDISVSALTNMSNLFAISENLSHIDNISNWDVSKVTNMGYMFALCTNLVDLNISNWNVVNLQYVGYMFYRCNNLSNESIDSIINMCINATNVQYKNLTTNNSYSPFYGTNISNERYANRWSNLTNAGWTY